MSLHAITKFYLDPKLYNEYGNYDLSYLVQSSPVLRGVHDVIKELHERSTVPSVLTEVEVSTVASIRLHGKYQDELKEFMHAVAAVDASHFSVGATRALFHSAYQKNLAAYLTTVSIPVLNGAESLDLADILEKLEEGSFRLHQPSDVVDYTTYAVKESVPTRTLPTYIEPLDEAIKGGLSPGQLGTYVGWPGIGKTLLLHQSAGLAFYHGYHAALITLEINKSEACKRLDKLFNRENAQEFTTILSKAKERNGKLTVLDATDDVFTPASVRSFLESQRRRGRAVDILFIDYADLMETGRNLEDYNELGEVYRQLRRLSNRFEIPIWTASQAVRSAFNKQWLGMGDIADSFKKARLADLIVTINQTEQEEEEGLIRLYVAKSRRNRGHQKLYLRADMDRMAVLSNGRKVIESAGSA